MNYRRLQPAEVREGLSWIGNNHYLGDVAGCVFALEFHQERQRIGAMVLGHPNAPGYGERIFELTRVFFIDATEHCVESKALAMMRKFVRTWFPQIRLLLAYSDATQGHRGTIYEADGWAEFGKTKSAGNGWKSRGGRKSTQGWPKQRWVRTP